jgi:hypothetical protein
VNLKRRVERAAAQRAHGETRVPSLQDLEPH